MWVVSLGCEWGCVVGGVGLVVCSWGCCVWCVWLGVLGWGVG